MDFLKYCLRQTNRLTDTARFVSTLLDLEVVVAQSTTVRHELRKLWEILQARLPCHLIWIWELIFENIRKGLPQVLKLRLRDSRAHLNTLLLQLEYLTKQNLHRSHRVKHETQVVSRQLYAGPVGCCSVMLLPRTSHFQLASLVPLSVGPDWGCSLPVRQGFSSCYMVQSWLRAGRDRHCTNSPCVIAKKGSSLVRAHFPKKYVCFQGRETLGFHIVFMNKHMYSHIYEYHLYNSIDLETWNFHMTFHILYMCKSTLPLLKLINYCD